MTSTFQTVHYRFNLKINFRFFRIFFAKFLSKIILNHYFSKKVWYALRPNQQTTVSPNYSQSIKIIIAPSDNGKIFPSTNRPSVLSRRLSDFWWCLKPSLGKAHYIVRLSKLIRTNLYFWEVVLLKTSSYFLFTAALHKHCYQVKEKYRDFYFLSQEGSNKYKHIQNPTHLQLKLQLLLLPSSLFFSSDPNVYETNKTSKIFLWISALASKKKLNQKLLKPNTPNLYNKVPLLFWLDLFLEARAEILEKISLVFWEIWRHRKDISKLTAL